MRNELAAFNEGLAALNDNCFSSSMGLHRREETFFSAMKCSAEDIKLCALDEVVIDETYYTVGYFHTKAHNQTVVILIDENFGEPLSLICSSLAYLPPSTFHCRRKRTQRE